MRKKIYRDISDLKRVTMNVFCPPEYLKLDNTIVPINFIFEVFLISVDNHLQLLYRNLQDPTISDLRTIFREKLSLLKNQLRKELIEFTFNVDCDKKTLPVGIKTIVSYKDCSVSRKINVPYFHKLTKPKKGEKEWTAFSIVSSI